jgi:hypothetical protein
MHRSNNKGQTNFLYVVVCIYDYEISESEIVKCMHSYTR